MNEPDRKVFCLNPWNYLAIEDNGNCYCCCSIYLADNYSIGNILENSVEEIWNGEKAQKLRRDVLSRQCSFCNLSKCRYGYNYYRYNDLFNKELDLTAPLPSVVHFSYDYTCSQSCVFCRDKIEFLSKKTEESYNKIIETKFLPLVSNAKIVSLSGLGEFLDSAHSRKLVAEIAKKNSNVKFEFWSNGINFNRDNIEKLGIIDRLATVHISVNAGSGKIHKRIFGRDNYKKVHDNIVWLDDMKKKKKIKELQLNYILNEINYKDMKKFVQFAQNIDCWISFSVAHSRGTQYTKDEKYYAVWNKNHYLYNDFIRTIRDPIYRQKNIAFDFPDIDLKPVSSIKIVKNFIDRFVFK